MRGSLLVGSAVALTLIASAAAAPAPRVPVPVQAQIKHRSPLLAYVPTRTAIGFQYTQWLRTPATVQIMFVNKAGFEINFIATRQYGSCRAGMETSYQLDGNKVYWSHTGAEQQAWRCVSGALGRQVRLVASSPQPPTKFAAVGLGRVVASGKRIP